MEILLQSGRSKDMKICVVFGVFKQEIQILEQIAFAEYPKAN